MFYLWRSFNWLSFSDDEYDDPCYILVIVTLRQFSVTFTLRFLQQGRRFPAMKKASGQKATPMRFESMLQTDVPTGRNGKHKVIMEQLLSDLSRLEEGKALKVPLSALPDTKENIRSALSRATRKMGMNVATSSDEEFLYVWKQKESARTGTGD
ncbi:MAG: hypothetical protein WCD57_03690 [Acidobacteriaceae bacterium]